MATSPAGLGLGQLLLALDRTMVTLVEAPRGLDLPVASAALVDADDVRLGLAVGAGSADVFFLLGVADDDAVRWLERQFAGPARVPAAIFVKEPSDAAVARAVAAGHRGGGRRTAGALGTALPTRQPRLRAPRRPRRPAYDSGTDLFGLAQSIADRTRGMVSIEDDQSHVLAYSASNDEADELRRLSILGRAGPPEHLAVDRPVGHLRRAARRRRRRARRRTSRTGSAPAPGGRHPPAASRCRAAGLRSPGTIWLQQGSAPLADDADDMLRGGAVLAARIMSRLAATPSTHMPCGCSELLGLAGDDVDIAAIARELGIIADGRAAVVGFHGAACAVAQPASSR